MKFKRSGRLIDMTRLLLEHPHELLSLSYFSEKYQSAKSSISEDLEIIKYHFQEEGVGTLVTVPGASGGVKYIPAFTEKKAAAIVDRVTSYLQQTDRWLPGDYLYMTDILGMPGFINDIGRMFASVYADQDVDVIMTMETKGIPLAYATAEQLGVPVVIARKASRITEGSTVSINYLSGSTKRVQSMVLARRSLPEASHVLIIDDFMKAGGTVRGMMNLLDEFSATIAGVAVLMEVKDVSHRLVDDYLSLLRLASFADDHSVRIEKGNYFSNI